MMTSLPRIIFVQLNSAPLHLGLYHSLRYIALRERDVKTCLRKRWLLRRNSQRITLRVGMVLLSIVVFSMKHDLLTLQMQENYQIISRL